MLRRNLLEPTDAADAALIEDSTARLIEEIKQLWNRSAVSALVQVGELIVNACYGGDVERWRRREVNGRLRRLENHERLPFGRKTIYLALHFYDLSLRVSDPAFLNELGVGHVRAVLGLPAHAQEELLRDARSNGWTISELADRAGAIRSRSGRKSGRPPLPPSVRTERRIRQHVEALETLISDPALIASCSLDRIAALRVGLAQLKAHLETFQLEGESVDTQLASGSTRLLRSA